MQSQPLYHRPKTPEYNIICPTSLLYKIHVMARNQQTYCSYFDYQAAPEGLTTQTAPYAGGMETYRRNELPGRDSGIMSVIIVVMLLVIFNMRHHKRFFVQIWHGLTNVRPRLNAFDDHTLNETRMVLALNLLACMSEAMMFISILPVIGISTHPSRALHAMLALMLMFSIYIVAQYTVYWIIGFVFASRTLRRQWISGFTSVQSFLGLTITLPALAAMFYPEHAAIFATAGAICYICWRIVFIVKGFRIFFHNYFSLVYFILYLCSVEIIPLLLLYRSSIIICNSLN